VSTLLLALLMIEPALAAEPDLVLHGSVDSVEMTVVEGELLRIDRTRKSCQWELAGLEGGLELEAQEGNVFDLRAVATGPTSFTMLLHCGERTLGPEAWTLTVLTEKQAKGSGASFEARELVGGAMPGPGRAARSGTPIAAQLWLFRGEVPVMEVPDAEHAQLLEVLELDGTGPVERSLEPGTYTAVMVLDGQVVPGPFTSREGVRTHSAFVVFPGRVTPVTVTDKRRAEF
jgi:hypothetical protein